MENNTCNHSHVCDKCETRIEIYPVAVAMEMNTVDNSQRDTYLLCWECTKSIPIAAIVDYKLKIMCLFDNVNDKAIELTGPLLEDVCEGLNFITEYIKREIK